MMNENALVIYKNKPAVVKEKSQEKITISLSDGTSIKVREKDIEMIHPGPVKNGMEDHCAADPDALREAWELLSAEGEAVSLRELAELVFGEYSPASAWAVYQLILDGLYFTGTVAAVVTRPQDQVEAEIKKREEKQKAGEERKEFLQRLKNRKPHPDDQRFIQDIESLACGKSEKSRTMKDIGLSETPEEAHSLLLECGFWTIQNNPHPARFGISLLSAKHIPDPPPKENRRDLTDMAAFAIDSPWSHDPDDAVSLEIEGGKYCLYVHVADPSASVDADSPVEREACGRGSTLYIPEGSIRMIAEEALGIFALGLAETSPALTFKMRLNDNSEIEETEIFPSVVKVLRLTYQEADNLINDTNNKTPLCDLLDLAERNFRRRINAGAIAIDLPETHIRAGEEVTIEPIVPYRSSGLVRECMLLAGEGAGIWAAKRTLPVPFAGQEIGDLPDKVLPGIAGAYQLRRCMRPRTFSVNPNRHDGLGLEIYTQVTSPLRRYCDLLAHIQIRSLLKGGTPLSADEVSVKMGAGEAAAAATVQAERASRSYWTAVYLSDKKNSVWDAIALEKKGNRQAVIIPSLALETQVSIRKDASPNDPLKLILKAVNIPKGEAVFVAEE